MVQGPHVQYVWNGECCDKAISLNHKQLCLIIWTWYVQRRMEMLWNISGEAWGVVDFSFPSRSTEIQLAHKCFSYLPCNPSTSHIVSHCQYGWDIWECHGEPLKADTCPNAPWAIHAPCTHAPCTHAPRIRAHQISWGNAMSVCYDDDRDKDDLMIYKMRVPVCTWPCV